ncbi:MAG: c-type cytochrome [Gemmatimonadales bacterium]
MRRPWWVLGAIALASCGVGREGGSAQRYGLGRAATPQEISALDIDVGPDGEGLPAGSGTVAQGELLFAQKCAVCHGAKGEGIAPTYPAIVGRDPKAEGFQFGKDPKLNRTIGNYWPYATTVFDYVRRAMPHPAPGSLTNDEVYALTAWLLAANEVIPANSTLDAASLKAVKMPYVSRFVPDNRRGGREVR